MTISGCPDPHTLCSEDISYRTSARSETRAVSYYLEPSTPEEVAVANETRATSGRAMSREVGNRDQIAKGLNNMCRGENQSNMTGNYVQE